MPQSICIYWVHHLQGSKHDLTSRLSQDDRSRINVFLKRKYLNWLEALNILRRISEGIQAMYKLESLSQVYYRNHIRTSQVSNQEFTLDTRTAS